MVSFMKSSTRQWAPHTEIIVTPDLTPYSLYMYLCCHFAGTDRSNMVEIGDMNHNYPLPYERTTMWTGAEIKWIYHEDMSVSKEDLALNLASSGFHK